jgi:hypothetical protein
MASRRGASTAGAGSATRFAVGHNGLARLAIGKASHWLADTCRGWESARPAAVRPRRRTLKQVLAELPWALAPRAGRRLTSAQTLSRLRLLQVRRCCAPAVFVCFGVCREYLVGGKSKRAGPFWP